jgi:calcium-dependent protein kinase
MHGGFKDRYKVPRGGALGEGGFGTVFTAMETLTGIRRAAKRILKSQLKAEPELFENEVNSMMELDHPHIMKLVEWFEEEDHFMLILELCTGPDLFDRIGEAFEAEGMMDKAETQQYIRQMLKAVVCCHSHGIIHRDIKPENFMFKRPDPTSALKMIDLGLSKLYKEGEKIESGGMTGTIAYMAPEMVQGKSYGEQCDIWSLGVIMWPMLTGDILFPHDSEATCKKLITNPAYLKRRLREIRGTVHRDEHDILSRMLEADPQKRISAKEALLHPYSMRTYESEAALSASSFDMEVVQKMENFVKQPELKRAAMIVVAHLIAEETFLQRNTFRQFDLNGDGNLCSAEFEAGCVKHGVSVPVGFGERVWPLVDLNMSKELDFVEFLAATIDVKDGTHDKLIEGVFQILDQQRSGVLAVDDFVELFPDNSTESIQGMVLESAPSGHMSYEEFHKMMVSSTS